MNCRLSRLGLVEEWRRKGWRREEWRREGGKREEWRREGGKREEWRREEWRREGEKRERKVRVKRAEKRRKEAKRVRGETLVEDVGWREEERVEEVVTEGGEDDQNSFWRASTLYCAQDPHKVLSQPLGRREVMTTI